MPTFLMPRVRHHRPNTPRAGGTRECGSVLSEFVLVVPVMLLIAGSALRFYQELQSHEIGMTLSREIATLAYNRCIDKTITTVVRDESTNQEQVIGDSQQTIEMISSCLTEQVLPRFINSWVATKPIAAGGKLTVAIEAYRCDIDKAVAATCVNKTRVLCEQTSDSVTSSCTVTNPATKSNLTPLRDRLVVARVDFTITPLASFIPTVDSRTVTYEATV